MIPTATMFVERLAEMTKNGKRRRTKTHRHYLCPCDVCGEAILTDSPGKRCKLTPECEGKHRKAEMPRAAP